MSTSRTIAVVGASPDRKKFGNKCVRCYAAAGWTVFPVHPSAATVEGLSVYASLDMIPNARLDRVSLYIPASAALTLLDTLSPDRVGELWLNPGVDTKEVIAKADDLGFNVVPACTIVAAGYTPADFPDE
jgi:uncharacterized protein